MNWLKEKAGTLTPEEKVEQAQLREEYIEGIVEQSVIILRD